MATPSEENVAHPHAQMPYFYEVGNRLNELLGDVELSAFLSRTFKTRYHELVSRGLNTMTGEDVLKLSSKLSVEEQQLFEGGRVSVMSVEAWWRGEASSNGRPGAPSLQPTSTKLPPQALLAKRSSAGGTSEGVAGGAGAATAAPKLPRVT
jgi:hypothetical protein